MNTKEAYQMGFEAGLEFARKNTEAVEVLGEKKQRKTRVVTHYNGKLTKKERSRIMKEAMKHKWATLSEDEKNTWLTKMQGGRKANQLISNNEEYVGI